MILVDKLEKYFKDEFNLSEIDGIKLRYSLELVIGEVSKFLILLSIFSVLGRRNDFIYSALSLLIIRLFMGGLHFDTYYGCLLFSSFFFYISIFLKNSISLSFKSVIVLFVFSLLTTVIFTPICGKSRPDYSYKKKLQFKLISTLLIFVHFLIYFFTHKNPYLINSVWVIALQSFQILLAKGVIIYEQAKINY